MITTLSPYDLWFHQVIWKNPFFFQKWALTFLHRFSIMKSTYKKPLTERSRPGGPVFRELRAVGSQRHGSGWMDLRGQNEPGGRPPAVKSDGAPPLPGDTHHGSFPVRCEVGAGTGVNMGGTAEALQLLSRLDTGQGLFFVVRRCLSMLPFNTGSNAGEAGGAFQKI